jgi:3-hydroxybutyryl-CoA dehydrogenase
VSHPVEELPREVGVVGGGTMGAGIAHAFLIAGSAVVLAETDQAAGERARGRVESALKATAERGKLDGSVEGALSRLTIAADLQAMAAATLVVEAVPEDAQLKAGILGCIEPVLSPEAVIATNTSSLSIDELGAALHSPERFLGLHFFNPVPASKLVEIVTGAATPAALAVVAAGWIERLGKTAIVVRSSP